MKLFGKEVSNKVKKDLIMRLVMIVISGTIIAVFAFNSVAWFSSVSKTDVTGMTITVDCGAFDILIVRQTAPEYDRTDNEVEVYSGTSALKEYISAEEHGGYAVTDTTYGDPTTAWAKQTDGTHMSIGFELINEEEDDVSHTRFLKPGAYGYIEFYIVPKTGEKENGKTYNFDISVNGFEYVEETIRPVSISALAEPELSEQRAKIELLDKIVKGHMLFFGGRSGAGTELSPYVYSNLIADYDDEDDTDDVFSYTTAEGDWATNIGGTGKQGYHVKIYWIWPITYDAIIDGVARGTYPTEVGTYHTKRPLYFFEKVLSSEGEKSNSYNDCDQRIGDAYDFLVVYMKVVQG